MATTVACSRVFGTVFQRDIQLAARLDAFIPVLAGLLDPFLLGDGKVDADGIDGGYDGEGAAFRADQVAYIRLGNAGDSVKGGIQHRIGKILFSQGQGRRGLLHLRSAAMAERRVPRTSAWKAFSAARGL